ncbi:MAG: single-stranded DNA-binding protein [Chlamydiae bacterium]|jgi:single-strand DNA-binding protein|nr:single-stranded DNA-binding protein [Chlamydiota bacterium]
MNHIVVAGHLGNDPETRFTPSGQKVVSFRVASNTRKGANMDTTWWKITVWGTQFDNMIKHLKKGSSIIVMGELQKPEIFTDKEGRPQISLNITAQSLSFSPFGKGDRQSQGNSFESASNQNEEFGASDANFNYYDQSAKGQGMTSHFAEEEIPF